MDKINNWYDLWLLYYAAYIDSDCDVHTIDMDL